MSEHPIIFSHPMVRAILDGTKTETRRIVKPRKPKFMGRDWQIFYDVLQPSKSSKIIERKVTNIGECPYGELGDILWVRETFGINHRGKYWYDADYKVEQKHANKKPSIHLPRIASRINLKIKNIRLEKLQDISENDAISEGVPANSDAEPTDIFQKLWESINGEGSWVKNPWVWVIQFDRIKP